ncbi:putative ABC transporter permease [Lacrimispora sp. 210928-DFI.3.58]|uniref:putative ABC transporter permease n=1 Tax=Lacrimispora sp. 210928-DFI.3.58 TaxID=2883214 RepID=UPI001D0624F0|nr:putative ABC transporter permease [Lacrimispora sp. 210928-DFI.3.58]MCB7319141.1 hypothetical protein [Lacrimispora sp. 210928-DFI.3.58]
MYEYVWYQWFLFFYVYCFFGWIFESTYVSVKERHFVNRGFLRLPMLPLYGTGAVMMLWVSLPVKDSLPMVYLSGVVAATILEYVTGWGMEKLFKMKYWDYSNQRFNLNGYICLSSSVAWGFLTIFLTEVIHRPIERYVLGLPVGVSLVCVSVISVLFVIDTAESVKAALDLAKVLDAMTAMRAELDDIQVQMALLKADTRQRVEEAKEVSALKLELAKAEAAARTAAIKQETAAKAAAMKQETAEKAALLCVEAAERMESLTDSAAGRMSRLANSTADRMNSLADSTAERISSLADSTAGRVGTLVEHTADKVTKTAGRLSELTEDAAAKVSSALKYTASSSDSHEGKESFSHIRRERLAALSQRLDEMKEKQHSLSAHIGFYHRSLLKGNPSASCPRFAEALKELREIIADTKH